MGVGEVRILNPSDIPNGIDLPAGAGTRDYIVVVGNTNTAHDVVANYVVKADQSTGASFGINAPSELAPQYSRQIDQLALARTPQQAIDNKVRAFERSGLRLHSASNPFDVSARLSARRNSQVASAAVPAVGDVINLKIPDASTDNLCTNFIATQAFVASVSRRAILAVDTLDGPPQLLFPQAVLHAIIT